MQDILMIQQWLLTIKRQRNFGRFRDVVADMKRQIFTPAQVKKRTESKSDLRVSAVTEGMTDIDDSMQASIMKKYERIEEQPPSNQPANLASNVSFVNGRWVKLGGEDKAVEDEGDENALDDLSDFGDDDDDAAPKARPDDLDGLSGFGDSDEDEDATTNKNGSSNAHHERSMSGPSGRQRMYYIYFFVFNIPPALALWLMYLSFYSCALKRFCYHRFHMLLPPLT